MNCMYLESKVEYTYSHSNIIFQRYRIKYFQIVSASSNLSKRYIFLYFNVSSFLRNMIMFVGKGN